MATENRIKLIHCADVHLDSALRTHLTEEKARERNNEILETFASMVRYAAEQQIQHILIAGDLFDKKTISAKARNFVYGQIRDHGDITFYYLKGNHDSDGFLEKIGEIPSNLVTFEDRWTTHILAENGNRLTLTAAELCHDTLHDMYHTLFLENGDFNIVMLHGQDAVYRSRDKAEVISLAELKNKNIDYLALGHVHGYKCEALDSRGRYCYPGCLEGRGFDECGQHGFVVLEVDLKEHTSEMTFVPIARRNTYEVKVDVSGCDTTAEALDRVERQLSTGECREKDLVKIVLTGEVSFECELDVELIRKHYEDLFYFVKVADATGLKIDYSRYQYDKSLKGEFIRHVMLQETMSQEEKAIVIRYGIQALGGEEIG